MKHIFLAASVVALAFAAPTALASSETENFVKSVATDALSENQTASARTVLDAADIDKIARFTLGRHSRDISDADMSRFQTALRERLEQSYREQIAKYGDGKLSVLGSTDRSEDDSVVETELTAEGQEPYEIAWRVIRDNGEYAIVDVQVNGLWLAIEQRAQIDAILDKPGSTIDTVISDLKG